MASLTNTKIKDTYDGLLKTTDNDALGGTYKLITDGLGNSSNVYLGTGGSVGIGTSTLNTISGSNPVLTLGGTGITGGLILQNSGTDTARIYETGGLFIHQGMSGIGHSFYVNASTEAMRIDSSGNVNQAGTLTIKNAITDSYGLKLWQDTGDTSKIFNHYNGALVFGTLDTERMRIDSSGNVGIGTSNPSSFNQRVNAPHLVVGSGSNSSGVTIYSGTTAQGSINFADGTTTTDQYTGGIVYAHGSNNYMSFHTNGGTERMRIDSSGNVGIGTSSPDFLLSTSGTGTNRISVNSTDSGTSGVYFRVLSGGSMIGNGTIATQSNGDMKFFTGTSSEAERMSITSDSNPTLRLGVSGTGTSIFEMKSASGGSSVIDVEQFLQIKTSGSERVRIDSSGRVGIGTTSPSFPLHVVTDSGTYEVVTIQNGSSAALFRAIGSGGGSVDFGAEVGTANTAIIRTGSTERMRITSGGDLLVGLTSIADATSRNFGNAFSGSSAYPNWTSWGSGSHQHAAFRNGTSQVGSISTTSTATAYNTSSDYRLKENVVDLTGALDRVDQLEPKRFNFIADEDTTVDGFLAHEVQDIVPEAVTGEKDATEEYEVSPEVLDDEGNVVEEAVMGTRDVYQGIDQSKLVPLLVGAIKELNAKVAALEAQINN